MGTSTNAGEGGARKGAPERVTVYYVTRPWRGDDLPEVTAFSGVRTAKQITLDRSPGFGCWGGPRSQRIMGRHLANVCYSPLDAVKMYRAHMGRNAETLRAQYEEACRHAANAVRLLDWVEHPLPEIATCGACGKPVTEGQHPGCYTTNVPEEVQS